MQISKGTGSRRCYFGEEKLKMDRIASDVTAVASEVGIYIDRRIWFSCL